MQFVWEWTVSVWQIRMMLINSTLLTEDVVIGISVSGETEDNGAIKLAKVRGARDYRINS